MKKNLQLNILCMTILIYFIFACFPSSEVTDAQSVEPISAGMTIPEFLLEPPGSDKVKEYLGLKDSKPFFVSHVSAKIIILEIFSFYCPHCRLQAPVLNKTFTFIQQDSELSEGIKMMGICAGGDKEKVDKWRTTLHVLFPLFTDPETTIWQKLGKPGVPCTLILTNSGKVLAAHYGAVEDTENFFRQIKQFYNEQK